MYVNVANSDNVSPLASVSTDHAGCIGHDAAGRGGEEARGGETAADGGGKGTGVCVCVCIPAFL